MIRTCTCKHSYQDEKHGKGKRVMNPIKSTGTQQYRCTVCKKVSGGEQKK